MTALSDYTVGDRVELAPHTDLWLRGARYGIVSKIGRKYLTVLLDRTGGFVRVLPRDIGSIVQHRYAPIR